MDADLEFIAAARAEMAERARRSILAFTLHTKPDYKVNWHHRALCRKLDDFVEGRIPRLMVFMPPRHGKSELVSRRLAPYLHGRFPDREIMTASYSDSLASEMTASVQKIMDEREYAEVFPDAKILPPGGRSAVDLRNAAEHTILERRGKYRGQGVGGSFTGKGAHYIIVDDPIKGREAADSEAFREKLWNFYTNDLRTRLEENGQILITQTRWHEDDLAGRLIELAEKEDEADKWEVLEFPAIREDMDNPVDTRAIGDALWPDKYPLPSLGSLKASVGLRGWSSLYQQAPTPATGSKFKSHMFQFGPVLDQKDYDFVFIMGDTAYEEKKENDFQCLTAFGVKGERMDILDVWHEQIDADKMEEPATTFIRRFTKYGFRGAYIEPKGHGIYLNKKWRRLGILVPTEEEVKEFFKDRNKDKVERANNAIPWLGLNKITINEAIPQRESLLSQLLRFPKAKHDDFADTVIDGVKFVYGRQVSILDVL